ncbi:MAG: DUF4440 domain-containing protein [Gemmatimonadota bacterium]|nr:MAG: DUF4440 domain-containing protein [Gemmatimonadota bacterium]
MKARSTVLALLLLGLATLACQPPAQQAGPLSEEDVAAIRAITEAYAQVALAGDVAALTAFYSEDAVLMPPNEPALEGRAAIQAWNEAQAALGTLTEATFTPVQIDGRGDLAFVRGTFSMTMTPEGALEPIQITGKYIEIKRKQADGSWLCVVDIWNSDHPLPQGQAGSAE